MSKTVFVGTNEDLLVKHRKIREQNEEDDERGAELVKKDDDSKMKGISRVLGQLARCFGMEQRKPSNL